MDGFLHTWIPRRGEGEDRQRIADEIVIENDPNSSGKSFYQPAVIEEKYIDSQYDLMRLAKEGYGFIMAEMCLYDIRKGRMCRAGRVHDNILRNRFRIRGDSNLGLRDIYGIHDAE